MKDEQTRGRVAGRSGMSLFGASSLIAVVAVFVLVSLPHLRRFAQGENEVDAQDTATLLARELSLVAATAASDTPPIVGDLVSSRLLRRSLSDAELAEDGRLLRRHGYLFAVVEVEPPSAQPGRDASRFPREVQAAERTALDATPPAEAGRVGGPGSAAPTLAIRAWPWKHGQTGVIALLVTSDGVLYRNENRDARWNGPRLSPVDPWSWDGWAPLR